MLSALRQEQEQVQEQVQRQKRQPVQKRPQELAPEQVREQVQQLLELQLLELQQVFRHKRSRQEPTGQQQEQRVSLSIPREYLS